MYNKLLVVGAALLITAAAVFMFVVVGAVTAP